MHKYLNQRQSATHLHLCIFDILSVFVDLYKNEYTYIQIDLTECSANVSKPCDKYNCVPCKWITRVVCLCMNLFDHCLTMYTRIFQSYMYEDGQHFGRMVLSTIHSLLADHRASMSWTSNSQSSNHPQWWQAHGLLHCASTLISWAIFWRVNNKSEDHKVVYCQRKFWIFEPVPVSAKASSNWLCAYVFLEKQTYMFVKMWWNVSPVLTILQTIQQGCTMVQTMSELHK